MPFDNPIIADDELRHNLMKLKEVRNCIGTPRRWSQGSSYTHGRFCIVGAIDSLNANGIEKILHKHLPVPFGDYSPQDLSDALIIFNDSHSTDHKRVMRLFDDAITDLETQME